MKIMTNAWRFALPASAAVAMLITVGCSQGTTRKDVADARQNVQEEKQETAQAQKEGQQNVAEAQHEVQQRTANKPVTPEQQNEVQQNVAEAKKDANQNVAEEKQETRQAEAKLKETQQNYQATQNRDAYVNNVNQKLASYKQQIDQLKQQASSAQGANKQAPRPADRHVTKRVRPRANCSVQSERRQYQGLASPSEQCPGGPAAVGQ